MIVYQGNPLYCPTYTAATPTECAIPGEDVHKFPITYSDKQSPINYNNETNEAYNWKTVQTLFRQQPCIHMCDEFKHDHSKMPCVPQDLRFRYPNTIHHVAISSKRVPFGLAICMIKVFTLTPTNGIEHAWALPHAEDALQNIYQKPPINTYSYFHRRWNHPEYPFIKRATPPVSDNETGKFTLDNLTLVETISGNLSSSPSRDSRLNLNERDNDKFNPVNRHFQQTPIHFTGPHHACREMCNLWLFYNIVAGLSCDRWCVVNY